MQMFIAGTSFDAINSMAASYVLDVITITGTGSKTYALSGVSLTYAIVNDFMGGQLTGATYSVSVSGLTVSWNVNNAVTLIVYGSPVAGTQSDYFGFQLFQYINGVRTVKLAPNYVPLCLRQIIDVPAGARTVQTQVPAGNPVMCFHRHTGEAMDLCWWKPVTASGYHALQFPTAGSNQTGCRVYVFSNILANIPDYGFFLYRDGQMVWHSNCLPLQVIPLTNGDITSATPLAVSSSVTSHIFVPQDPAYPTGYSNFMCASAGKDGATYKVQVGKVFQSTYISNPDEGRRMRGWACGGVGYIDTRFYDQYYKNALGIT